MPSTVTKETTEKVVEKEDRNIEEELKHVEADNNILTQKLYKINLLLDNLLKLSISLGVSNIPNNLTPNSSNEDKLNYLLNVNRSLKIQVNNIYSIYNTLLNAFMEEGK